MRSGWLRCVAVAGSLTFLLSCGGSSSKSASFYLVSQGSTPGTISAYSLDLKHGTLSSTNGALTPVGKSAPTGSQPTALILDPTQSFAYVANYGDDSVSTFTVNKDGSLAAAQSTTPVATSTTPATRPIALAMDSGGHFLFVANQGIFLNDPTLNIPGSVSVFSTGSSALTQVAGSPFVLKETSPPLPLAPSQPLPVALAVSNQGNFLYVADRTNGAVAAFSFDATSGALTRIPGTCPGLAPCFGFLVGTAPSAVFSPPAGNFLYVANAGSNDIYEFSINTDGSLSPSAAANGAAQVTIATGVGPTALISDPGAKYLYALANQGSQITGYTINHVTGLLTALSANGGTVSTGANPVAMAIRSDGNSNGNFWLFTANYGANSVSTFGLTYTTGALSPLPQLTSPLAPYGVGVH
jgi:6-phosphogluconolactonase